MNFLPEDVGPIMNYMRVTSGDSVRGFVNSLATPADQAFDSVKKFGDLIPSMDWMSVDDKTEFVNHIADLTTKQFDFSTIMSSTGVDLGFWRDDDGTPFTTDGIINAIKKHGEVIQKNIYQIMGGIQNCVNFYVRFDLPPPWTIPPATDPCSALVKSVIGSTMGEGAEILQLGVDIYGAATTGYFQRSYDYYKSFFLGYADRLKEQMRKEIEQMMACAANALAGAFLFSIPGLFLDPCTRQIFDKLGVPDFTLLIRNAVHKIPGFPSSI